MLYELITLAGIGLAAVSGALAAGRKHLDLIGVIVLALVTAMGGGTLRDLLLYRQPIFWIADPTYILVILVAAGSTVLYARFRDPPWKALLYADAVMLAFFSISGARAAEEGHHAAVIVVAMGTITGSAGGVLRDVLIREVPLLFRQTEPLYATASIVGASAYILLQAVGLPPDWAAALGMLVVLAIRFASITFGWRLPIFAITDPFAEAPKTDKAVATKND